MQERVKKIFKFCEDKVDAIFLKNSLEPYIDHNFFYVTNLEKGIFEGCAAILFPDGTIDLISSELEAESARKTNANIKVYKNLDQFNQHLTDSLKHVNKIGLNSNGILLKDYKNFNKKFNNIEITDVSSVFSKARMIKEELELSKIKNAANIAEKVIKKIPDIIYPNISEDELASEIEYMLMKNGADKPAFETISSFGKNTAEPHYTHGDKKLKNQEYVLCDFGARFNRYNSDMTRTFISGKPTKKHQKIHKTVIEAQKKAFENIKPGIKANKIHNAVESVINNSEFKGLFTHSTGHSLGLLVHDGGVGFSSECEIVLEKNMVLTVEPGIYLPNFGGVRIEDDIVIKKNGFDFLTNATRELIEI